MDENDKILKIVEDLIREIRLKLLKILTDNFMRQ